MAKLISLPQVKDSRGSLSVIEKILPFPIRRVFFIYDVSSSRGGHRHRETRMALVALGGKVRILCQTPTKDEIFWLENPGQCLLLEPEDWHVMDSFDPQASLVVLASHDYDKDDYIHEKYR